MYIDTHCHLNYKPLSQKIDHVISQAQDQGVEKLICIGTNLDTSRESVRIATNYENVYAAVGIHPNDCENAPEDWKDQIIDLAGHYKVVGIGETGVDLYRSKDTVELQKEFFADHIKIARSLDLPVIIHNRQADEAVLEVLDELEYEKFVMHCYSSDANYAEKILQLGGKISFTGNITYKSKKRHDAVQKIPLDRIMVETDAPFLTPSQIRDKNNYNQPAFVTFVAEKIASLKNISLEEVEKTTTQNAIQFFNIDS